MLRIPLPAIAVLLSTLPSVASPASPAPARPTLPFGLADPPAMGGRTSPAPVAPSLEGWRAMREPRTARVELLFGPAVSRRAPAVSDGQYAASARELVAACAPVLGIDPATLVDTKVTFLPLGLAGTTDKVTVAFEQRAGSRAIEGARVNALLDARGAWLAVQSTAVPGSLDLPATFALSSDEARALARARFERETGLSVTREGGARLVALALDVDGSRVVRLVWSVELAWETSGALPVGRRIDIDARSGEVLRSLSTVHTFDVGGSVTTLATPGTLPDTAANPEVFLPCAHLTAQSAQGEVDSDAGGAFTIPGASGPLSVTFAFDGPFARVLNAAGSEYSLTTTLSGLGNPVQLNPSATEFVTAQANAFVQINALRDWIRGLIPSDNHADFRALANCNINSSCNAFFDGASVNFFRQSGCVNTAYSTVIAHEMGHWLNVKYGTGNGMDGMGEGNADVWAMYLFDDPVVGKDFCGPGCDIRDGTNNLQFCGDCCPGCHGGEVHQEGKVWMGAAWKVRQNLNQTLGDVQGDLTADLLFLGWMNAFNQGEIRSVIETQWLLLDDDDGDLFNGSPHYPEIDGGFRQQGFPGVDLEPITIDFTGVPGDSSVEAGPYDVRAVVKPHMGQNLVQVELRYRIGSAAEQVAALYPQLGDEFLGTLPDVAAPAHVSYYVRATDDLGNTAFAPAGGAAAPLTLSVGSVQTIWNDGFESPGGGGWTHGSYQDTSNTSEDWEFGWPGGQEGTLFDGSPTGFHWSDPPAPYAGLQCAGTDLGMGTNGRYANDVHTFLRSPAIDATGAVGTKLRFRRWLSVERDDRARVRVNGHVVWESDPTAYLLDDEWSEQVIDVAEFADDQPVVVIEFELLTNGDLTFGGWNLDDVRLTSLGPATAACAGSRRYGPSKINSLGFAPALLSNGLPSPGGGFELQAAYCVPNQPMYLFSGGTPADVPFAGGVRLVGPPFVREAAGTLESTGSLRFPIAVSPAMVGTTRFYQGWYRDPAHPDGTGVGLTSARRVTYCP